MGRPLWDKRTPFWLVLALASVAAFVFIVWRGEQSEKETQSTRAKSRIFEVATAYLEASAHLGRSPKSADELKPYLKSEESLRSARDGEPLEAAWGATVPAGKPGQLLVWESRPDADGGRWVFVTVGEVRYVTEAEFHALRDGPPVNASPPR